MGFVLRSRFLEVPHGRGPRPLRRGIAHDWDVLCHRIAPDTNIELEWLRQAGRLKFTTARLVGAVARERGIEVTIEGEDGRRRISAGQVICCTGSGTDISQAEGLIGHALTEGIAVADQLGLYLQAGRCGALVNQTGSARGPMYTLSPPRRGELWETTAVREIRAQAEDVAFDLCRGLSVAAPPTDEMPAGSSD